MEVYGVISGEISGMNYISGALSTRAVLGASLSVPSSAGVVTYDGEYEFTPSETIQTIEIANKKALEDIIINPIPQNYGLITWNGLTLTVS